MKRQLPNIAIAIILFSCLVIDFSFKNWEKQDRVVEWDVHSYYAYLPAKFVYDDIKLIKDIYRFEDNYYLFWPSTTLNGKKVIKTSMGMSILYAPFFFVAHTFAKLSDYPENGFSEPYKMLLLFSAIFYLFIGLDFLKKILTHYHFNDIQISITLLLVGLGTNLLAYSSQSAPMPHAYSFCLISVFIYYTIKWYQNHSIINTIILGLLLGLITLIRPTNILIGLIFVFYNISNLTEFKERMIFLKKHFFLLNLILLLAVLIWVPQFIYWKIVTGNYLYYSYTGERFFFNDPQLINGLFSFRKGWLIYTPIMAFAIMGIVLMRNALKGLRLAIILFLIVNIYVIFSWWCWWYGGTYGQRSLIDSYALMAIPLASFVKFISEKKWLYNMLFGSVAIFLIWLNVFQTFQFEYFSLHWDGMTKDLYFKQFGKIDKIANFDQYVKSPDYEKAKLEVGMNVTTSNELKVIKQEHEVVKNNYSKKIEKSRKTIYLKACNGKFLSAEGPTHPIVIANRDKALEWETFTLIKFDQSESALISHDNHFFSAELTKQNEITSIRETAGYWETFTLVELDNNYVAFKAVNGKYLSLNEIDLQLFATSDSISKNEKFLLIDK